MSGHTCVHTNNLHVFLDMYQVTIPGHMCKCQFGMAKLYAYAT